MAEALTDLLQPGEVARYHARRRWRPNDFLQEASIYLAALALVWAAGPLRFDSVGLITLTTTLSGPLVFWLWTIQRDWSREALVTQQRLIYRSGWPEPEIIEVPAANVRQIRAVKSHLRLVLRNDLELQLGHPHEAWALAGALAQSANLPLPRLPSDKDLWADWLHGTLVLAVWLAIALPLLRWLLLALVGPELALKADGTLACLFLLSQLLILSSLPLAGLLTVLLIRPFFTAAEMAAWIEQSFLFWPLSAADGALNGDGQRCRRLAAWLYGQLPSDRPVRDSHGG